jgi:hypothetical protein
MAACSRTRQTSRLELLGHLLVLDQQHDQGQGVWLRFRWSSAVVVLPLRVASTIQATVRISALA